MRCIKWTREYFSLLRNNLKLLACCLAAVPAIILLNNYLSLRSFQYYGLALTAADSVFQLAKPLIFGMTVALLSMFLTFHLVKYDCNESFVYREASKTVVWGKQAFKALLTSLLFALYTTLCAIVIGGFTLRPWINWGSEQSAFATETGVLAPSASFWQVAGLFLLTVFLLMAADNFLVLLLHWLTNRYLTGWAVVLALSVADFIGIQVGGVLYPVYYGVFAMNYARWTDPVGSALRLLYPILLILALFFAGRAAAGRKDFLNAHQK